VGARQGKLSGAISVANTKTTTPAVTAWAARSQNLFIRTFLVGDPVFELTGGALALRAFQV